MIKYFDIFAGIGAFRSAFEKVGGYECVGWCEIDRYAQKAYRALYDTKGEFFYEDITKIDYGAMPDFDMLVGGPPCQSWSCAGLRKGFEDDRGNMFLEYIRLLEAKKPKYFVAENVAGLLSHSQGRSYGIILEKICELGYSVCWRVCPKGTSFGRPTAQISALPKTGKECILSDILEKDAPSKYWLSEKAAMKIAKKAEKKQS